MRRRRALRPIRTAWAAGRIWQRRGILLCGSVLIGLAAIMFARAADLAHDLNEAIVHRWPFAPLLVTPLGFALLQFVTGRWFAGAQGSGIPQVIAVRASTQHEHRKALLSVRVTVGKVVLVLAGLVVGASVGREGPTVQVGAAIMFGVAALGGIGRQRGLVLAGAAAGVAAAFNTPLAGILFAIEELAKSFERRITAISAATVVLAGMTSVAISGPYVYFGTVSVRLAGWTNWAAVPVCAVFGGIAGGAFSRLTVGLIRHPPRLFGPNPLGRCLFAGLCGLGVALLALATANFAAGTGYAETRDALSSGTPLPLWYGPAKLVSTLLSSVSGIPGGLFSPSLSVGAAFASLLHPLLFWVDPRSVAILSMAAYFAGVVQSPLTAFVIVVEMTESSDASLPLLATTLMAAGISRLVSSEPLYHALSRGFEARVHAGGCASA